MNVLMEKDAQGLAVWLGENGVPASVCEIFEENEIDGPGFFDLTELDIKSMVPKLGIVKKICRLQVSSVTSNTMEVPVSSPPTTCSGASPSTSIPGFSKQSTSSAYPSSLSSFRSTHSRDMLSPEIDDSVSVASSTSSIKRKDFVIPDLWRPSIMTCIQAPTLEEQKKLLTSSVRGEISRDLVTQMHAFKTKPDRAFCTLVAKSLVKKYPFMKDSGRNVSGYGSWEKRIIDRVHNIRSTSSRKRASTDDIEGTPTKRGRPKGSSLLNRYPPVPDSDNDTVSNERNLIALKKEMEKEKPRKDVILSLLHQTFQIRRDEILSDRNEVSVSSILSSYKALSLPYAIEQEMGLILGRKDAIKVAVHDWNSQWAPAIIQLSESLTGKQGTVYKQNQMASHGHEEEQSMLAFLQLCSLLQKKGTIDCYKLIYEEHQMADDPQNVCDNSISAPRLAGFVGDESLFFQEFVFGLPEKTNKGATYLTVTSDISKFVQE